MSDSIVNKDKETVDKGRSSTLKDEEGVKASLRDQIPQKLLEQVRKKDLGKKVVEMWHLENSHRREFLDRQRKYLRDWDEFLESSDAGPFEGSSTLHLPMPLIVAKTLHARYFQALMGVDPGVKARTSASADRQDMVSDTMRYAVNDWANKYDGFSESLDDWAWNWLTTGSGTMKLRWEVEFSRFVDVDMKAVPGAPRIQVDEDGTERTVPVIKFEEQEVNRVKKVFEGPWLDEVPIEDIVIVGGRGNPQNAEATIHRDYIDASKLWTLVDREIFEEQAVKNTINAGPDAKSGGEGSDIKQEKAEHAGKAGVDKATDLDEYEILEAYLKTDVDDSGINSHIVLWVHANTKEILSANYLYRLHKSGEVPIFRADFHRRSNEDQPVGIIEMLHPLSVEMDAIHNMRIDFGLLSNMPFGFYRPTSSIDPEVISLEPGALIPVDNPQTDVFFPNMGNRTVFGFQEEAAIQQMVDRLSGVNDLSLGLLSSQQGATRTATGTRALLGESTANLNVHLRRLLRAYRRCLNCLLHMLQQRIPAGLSFRINDDGGADYWRQIKSQTDIAGDFDFDIDFDSSSSNPQIQAENARLLLEITSNPLDFQIGVLTPASRYEALRNFLMKGLGLKDVSKYIQKPNLPRIFTPEEEVGRILRGIPTPITPEGDHDSFIAFVEQIFKTPEVMGKYGQEEIAALRRQQREHQKMLEALEQMAAEQRELSQQRRGAQQSANQAQPGQSPVAGSGGPTEPTGQ